MKITLCGSTRFMDQFHAANVALTLAGHVVYSVATSTKGDFQPTEDQKLMLDMVHLRKIDASDLIMVVGRQEDGSTYIGESTRREIAYARAAGKEVYIYEPGKKITGPTTEFEADMENASMTNAIREEKQREHERANAQYIASFVGNPEDTEVEEDEEESELSEDSEKLA